ncbi:MAG: 30S ribosomal protein S20 [Alphaproteobacteria bacterium]|nr:30S ribosomal protein S20 [Alphaproteobacteria bacterium]
MPNHKSAIKRVRRNERRTVINKNRMSRIRTFVKSVESAIATNDKDAANENFKTATSQIMKGVSKGLLHKNTASRKISRLAAKVKALS